MIKQSILFCRNTNYFFWQMYKNRDRLLERAIEYRMEEYIMAKARKSTTKRATTKTTTTTAKTTVSKNDNPTTIIPRVPRQLPLKPLSTIQKKKSATSAVASEEVILQLWDREISNTEILARVREEYNASGENEAMHSVKAYVKPEEGKIYYVVNETFQGSIDY